MSCDAVFLEDQFIQIDDWYEGGCGQTNCVGYVCITHGEDSNEGEEFEFVGVASNTEPFDEVAPVSDVTPADVDHVDSYKQHTRKHFCWHFLCLTQSIK